nr:MAG TPA: N-terminal domain of cytochrome oxidase-cbb3, FixP [Caudoviricetes sp.]
MLDRSKEATRMRQAVLAWLVLFWATVAAAIYYW